MDGARSSVVFFLVEDAVATLVGRERPLERLAGGLAVVALDETVRHRPGHVAPVVRLVGGRSVGDLANLVGKDGRGVWLAVGLARLAVSPPGVVAAAARVVVSSALAGRRAARVVGGVARTTPATARALEADRLDGVGQLADVEAASAVEFGFERLHTATCAPIGLTAFPRRNGRRPAGRRSEVRPRRTVET